MVLFKKSPAKKKDPSTYQKAKKKDDTQLERAVTIAAHLGATLGVGAASYPHSESNPVYINWGLPGHETMENFFNGALHSIHVLDPSANINLPEITPIIAGAIYYAGYRRSKDISEKRLKTYEKIESAIGEGVLNEIMSGSGDAGSLDAKSIYQKVKENMKKNAKKGFIFKSDDQKTSEFLEKHPEMYINFTKDVLDALKNPDKIEDKDMEKIIGRIKPYYDERKRNEQLYEVNASILREKAKKDDSLNSLRDLVDSLKEQNTGLHNTVETLKSGYVNEVVQGAVNANKLVAAIGKKGGAYADSTNGKKPETATGDITDEYGELTGVSVSGSASAGETGGAEAGGAVFKDVSTEQEGPKAAPDVIYLGPVVERKFGYETALEDLDKIDDKVMELLNYINNIPSALSEKEHIEGGRKISAYKPKNETRKVSGDTPLEQRINALYEIRKARFVGNQNADRISTDKYSKMMSDIGIDVSKYSSLSEQLEALKANDLEQKTREKALAASETEKKLQDTRNAYLGINPNGTTTDIGTYKEQMKGIGIDVAEHPTREQQLAALGISNTKNTSEAQMAGAEYKAMFRKNGLAGRTFKEDFSDWKDSRGM